MSYYGLGLYGAGLYGVSLKEVSGITIVNTGIGNQLNIAWTNPTGVPSAFNGVIVLRSTSSISNPPTNAISYSVNDTIGNATVVFIGDTLQDTFLDTTVLDNILYYYKIFTFNNLYYYSSGVESFGTSTDVYPPASVINFDVQNPSIQNTLYMSWVNPTDADLAGIRLVRKIGSYPTSVNDGVVVYNGTPITEFYDTTVDNYTPYYYAAYAFDEVPLYSNPAFDWDRAVPLIKDFKFIRDKVSDFQAIVDRERTTLYWEPINRTLNLKALRVDGSNISLAARVSVGDSSSPFSTFISTDIGLSSVDDAYLNEELIFLSKYNIISRPKKIVGYNGTSKAFTIEDVEYIIEPLSFFGLKSVSSLIDDPSIYVDSTLTVNGSGFTVTSHDVSNKMFTVAGTPSMLAGDSFTLTTTYYPRLYISTNNGVTYDTGTDIVYTVANSPTPTVLENHNYYNRFIALSSELLNTTDPNFYIGAYITFITGANKGLSRKIVSFDVNTREFVTQYFENNISQNDVFSINTYSMPVVNDIANYVFKMVFWNGNNISPIYGEDVVVYPSLSLQNYLTSLNNGYWDINLNTNLYKIIQGVAKENHSRAELETELQKRDFSIKTVRDFKLSQNFGNIFNIDRDPGLPQNQYRKRLQDTIKGFRNTSLYEGLNQLSGAFNKIPVHYESLAALGWRIGDNSRGGKRLAYSLDWVQRSVLTGDYSSPYTTFTTYTTGASGNLSETLDFYKDSYILFTSCPSGEFFDQTLFGDFLLVDSYSASGGISTFTLNSGIGINIPNGAEFLIITPNESNPYGTIPYGDVAALFGIRLYVFGPFMTESDRAKFEELVAKIIPAHVKTVISYQTKFVGDSTWFKFDGDKVNLQNDYSLNILRPIKDVLLETGRLTDTFTTSVSAVYSDVEVAGVYYSNFTGVNLTTKYNYYKDKYIKFTTGSNSGISRKVIEYLGSIGSFTTEKFPYAINSGDTFEIEKVNYQTKYVTQVVDVLPDVYNINLFDNKFNVSWFTRKTDSVEEKIYIQFSDDSVNYTVPREAHQNEQLNSIKGLSVSSVVDNSTFSTAVTGSTNAIARIDNYYKNGYIKFTSGANDGLYRKILSYDADTLTFITEPFDNTINVRDSFQLLDTEIKKFAKLWMYHNNLKEEDDVEIESLVIKIV